MGSNVIIHYSIQLISVAASDVPFITSIVGVISVDLNDCYDAGSSAGFYRP